MSEEEKREREKEREKEEQLRERERRREEQERREGASNGESEREKFTHTLSLSHTHTNTNKHTPKQTIASKHTQPHTGSDSDATWTAASLPGALKARQRGHRQRRRVPRSPRFHSDPGVHTKKNQRKKEKERKTGHHT
eukprot:3393497-Rhodomonas_salina.1